MVARIRCVDRPGWAACGQPVRPADRGFRDDQAPV